MDKVKLCHPRIDGGARVIEVPESAVREHARSGWERVADDPPQDAQQAEAPDMSGASSLEDTEQSPRRRRANRGDE
jgi:hypothetical protein